MAPHKVVVKCGSYAVLVELQIIGPLSRGAPQETSWFTMEHTEEVTSLVRDAVDRRVRLYIDCLHKRGQPKHKRELPHANPLCVKGRRVSLVANFVKRHFNLRCIVKHQYGELRVFPERYVVCVSRLEDASANPTPAVTVSQSTESQYFSRPAAETRDELNSSTITKRSSLQKIARHAHARPRPETQPLPCGSVLGKKLQSEQNRVPGEQVPEPQPPTDQPRLTTDTVLPHGHPTTSTDPRDTVLSQSQIQGEEDEPSRVPGNTDPRDTVLSQSQSQGEEDEPSRVPGNTDPRDTVLSQSQSQGVKDEPSRVPGNTDPRDTVLSQSQSQGEEDEPSRVPGNTDPRDTVLSQSQSQGVKDEPSRVPGNTDPRDTVLSQSQSQGEEEEPSRVPGNTDPRDTVLSQSQSQGEEEEPSRVPGNTDPRDTVLSQSQSQGKEEEPSRVPGEDEPSRVPGEDEPSRVPGEDEPSRVPGEDPPSRVPGEDPPSRVPGEDPPSRVPGEDPPSRVPGEDPPSRVPGEDPPRAKRVCLEPLLVACSSNDLITPTHSAESSNPLLPPPPLSSPRPLVVKSSAKTESEAFPAPAAPLSPLPAPERTQSTAPLSPLPAPERTQSQTSQTTVEVELLTPGKQSQSLLPLTSSNNTEQTNQNSPAAGLRGRSVKDVVSSALSIASTYISIIGEAEEGRENGGRKRRRGEEKRREEKRGKIMEGKRGEEREVGEEERSVARPSRLRRLKR
ncbi:protein SLX4IP [Oncorhynchus keta]|uniref:protein SLX4IP n=1 Tax=Oncorhynchus keta TaxID=8018 RepID=UPI00227D2D43|nr:protein SLX4IP [Oncorhynchus keta]XP_052352200.1 protein SLX4IP [Oncorhynchus keta]XP_052352201.1 protein SLX4IP [Oncorhynchus keta]